MWFVHRDDSNTVGFVFVRGKEVSDVDLANVREAILEQFDDTQLGMPCVTVTIPHTKLTKVSVQMGRSAKLAIILLCSSAPRLLRCLVG